MNKVDTEYFRVVNDILTNGRVKKNRTGIDTIGIFGAQAKYDIDLNAFPILTTKKVHFPAILHELIWFIKGDTNIKYLVDNNVRIWNEWAYKRYVEWYNQTRSDTLDFTENWNKPVPEQYTQDEFIQLIKEDENFAFQWGELGEGTYGGMWRDFPFFTEDNDFVGSSSVSGTRAESWIFGGVDQLQKVVDKLKKNPDDRRMIVSAWHPYWVDHCALPPCHCLFHFNTEELTYDERFQLYLAKGGDLIAEPVTTMIELFDVMNIPKRRLNCLLYQRSCDFFLGVPFNITSYALLTAMIAHVTNMETGTFTHTYGDAHIYTNHMEQCKIQMSRTPKSLPKLWINPNITDLFSFKYEDIRLENYDSHPVIKADVAI